MACRRCPVSVMGHWDSSHEELCSFLERKRQSILFRQTLTLAVDCELANLRCGGFCRISATNLMCEWLKHSSLRNRAQCMQPMTVRCLNSLPIWTKICLITFGTILTMFCINSFQTKPTTPTIFDLVDTLTLWLLRLTAAISLTDCFTKIFTSLSSHFHFMVAFCQLFH